MTIERVERYGVPTVESSEMDAARKAHCLCLSCAKLHPGQRDNCVMAETLFALCKTKGMAMGVSRCAEWVSK